MGRLHAPARVQRKKELEIFLLQKGLIVFILLCFTKLHGLNGENPSAALIPEAGLFLPKQDPFGMKVEYLADFCFNGKLEIDKPKTGFKRKIDRFYYQQQLGRLVFNFIDRVEAYAGAGAMQAEVRERLNQQLYYVFESPYAFAWELGGRAAIIFWKRVRFGMDAKYIKSPLGIKRVSIDGSKSVHKPGMRFHAWQVSGGLSYHFKYAVPYVGIAFFKTRLNLRDLEKLGVDELPTSFRLVNRKRVILFSGLTLSSDKVFSLNLEGRCFAELGFTLTGALRF